MRLLSAADITSVRESLPAAKSSDPGLDQKNGSIAAEDAKKLAVGAEAIVAAAQVKWRAKNHPRPGRRGRTMCVED